MTAGLCAGAALTGDDLWFSDDPAEREEAKRICDRCTASPGCLRGALERGERWGIWGGLDLGVVEMAEPVAHVRVQVYAPVHNRAHYVAGCREPECLAANTAYVAEWRATHTAAPVRPPVDVPQLDLFDEIAAVTTSAKVMA